MPGNSAITVIIGADNSDFLKACNQSQRALKKTFGPDALALSQKCATALGIVTAAASGLGIAFIKMSADFKVSERAFTTLLGNTDLAKKHMNDLAEFAANTPFELKGLVETSKKMLAFRFQAEDVIPIMAAVGDAAAMLGSGQEGIDGIIMAISQIQAKGRAQGEELLQLAERGVNAYRYLADALGTDVAGAMDLVRKGAVDSTTAINAIVGGMQRDFKGGMEGLSREIPGILSNISDNATRVMRSIGNEITEAFDVKEKLASASAAFSNFAAEVEANGLSEALKKMIPPEVTLAIFAFAGAITAAAIPALVKMGLAAAAALKPLLPYIVAGAALGSVAWVIWRAWSPVADLFGNTWAYILSATNKTVNKILEVLYGFAQKALKLLRPVFNLFGMDDVAQSWSNAVSSKLQVATANIGIETGKQKESLQGMSRSWEETKNSIVGSVGKIASAAKSLNTTFNGLSGASSVNSGSQTDNSEKSASKTPKEKTIKIRVETPGKTFEQIEVEWQQTRNGIIDKAQDLGQSIKDRIATVGLKGVEKERYDIFAGARDSMSEMERSYRDLSLLFRNSTVEEQAEMRKAWRESGVVFEEVEQGKVSFAQQMASERQLIEAETAQKLKDLHYEERKFNDDMEQAKLDCDMAAMETLLSSKQALMNQQLEAERSYMDSYYEAWKGAHKSWLEYMTEAITGFRDALASGISDLLTGAASVGEALQAFGESVIRILADMAASWLANVIAVQLFKIAMPGQEDSESQLTSILTTSVARLGAIAAETAAATASAGTISAAQIIGSKAVSAAGLAALAAETAASVAAGAAVAAAWAPAAAAVSLASFGSNSGPAMAGITATHALSKALSVPGLADGGIVSKATLALIGEGKEKEAVVPLNRRVFERMGLTGGGRTITQNVYGDINNAADLDDLFGSLNKAVAAGLRG